ncbi:hypothetical protein ZIOFF_021635 [Zingiber officinale]|uniref:Amine oxidase domain-containing protein n=1 Tax=Zingiber officinale TaxID=94328 RepID=A0A8J5H0J4_ZINOF|nr:hypothetical protein ZIOFF_021635 [Zingiber officinale]
MRRRPSRPEATSKSCPGSPIGHLCPSLFTVAHRHLLSRSVAATRRGRAPATMSGTSRLCPSVAAAWDSAGLLQPSPSSRSVGTESRWLSISSLPLPFFFPVSATEIGTRRRPSRPEATSKPCPGSPIDHLCPSLFTVAHRRLLSSSIAATRRGRAPATMSGTSHLCPSVAAAWDSAGLLQPSPSSRSVKTEARQSHSPSAIVIGGGFAGIAAAHALKNAAFQVVLLESQDRIGGRVHTNYSFGFPVDMGAAWLHGVCNENPLASWIGRLDITDHGDYNLMETNLLLFFSYALFDGDGHQVPQDLVEKVGKVEFEGLGELRSKDEEDEGLGELRSKDEEDEGI